ncbi:unnamed protein product, partial [Meganyctiphanes norvegica]
EEMNSENTTTREEMLNIMEDSIESNIVDSQPMNTSQSDSILADPSKRLSHLDIIAADPSERLYHSRLYHSDERIPAIYTSQGFCVTTLKQKGQENNGNNNNEFEISDINMKRPLSSKMRENRMDLIISDIRSKQANNRKNTAIRMRYTVTDNNLCENDYEKNIDTIDGKENQNECDKNTELNKNNGNDKANVNELNEINVNSSQSNDKCNIHNEKHESQHIETQVTSDAKVSLATEKVLSYTATIVNDDLIFRAKYCKTLEDGSEEIFYREYTEEQLEELDGGAYEELRELCESEFSSRILEVNKQWEEAMADVTSYPRTHRLTWGENKIIKEKVHWSREILKKARVGPWLSLAFMRERNSRASWNVIDVEKKI